MPRKYELVRLKRDELQGKDFWRGIPADLVESFMHSASPYEHVTAIDERDVEPLVEALREAVDMVHDWASYASEYFQEKHDLEGDLNRLRAALKPFEAEEGQ